MKIALIGTHGTGKTTLAYGLTAELKKHGINATMCTEVARRCPLPINKKGSFKSQLWIIATQIKEEIEAEKDYDVVVCDRSVMDSYIYTKHVAGNDAEKILSLVKEHLKTYSFLFKTRISEGYLVPDGIRDTDPAYQKKIDELMNEFLKQNKIKYFELPKENQIEFIKKKINLKKQKHLIEF